MAAGGHNDDAHRAAAQAARAAGNGACHDPAHELRAGNAQLRADARQAARQAALRDDEAVANQATQASATAAPTPGPEADLLEAAQAVLGASRDAIAATGSAAAGFGHLLKSDLALARASLVSAVVLGLAAGVAALTCWALLVGLLVLGLAATGLPQWAAVAAAALLVLLLAVGLLLFARSRLKGTQLAATRRQWALLRHGGPPA